jgi:hypothetical protein
MAYHKRIVFILGEFASGGVCDGDILEDHTRFKCEGGDNGEVLFGDEFGERILRLVSDILYGI